MPRALKRGTKSLLRDINNSRVLQIVQRKGPVSRAEIARLAELPPPTVTSIVGGFLRADLVREVMAQPADPNGEPVLGRPPILLELNENGAFTVGVKLYSRGMTVAVMDLTGRLLHHDDREIRQTSPDLMLGEVAAAAADAVTESGVDQDRVVGMGIGLPGLIDHGRGICRDSPLLGWGRVEVAALLEDLCGMPVYVDNDVNLLTAAEIAFGEGRGASNFLTVTVGRGIGLGVVVGGEIYRGAFGGAGELGHIKVGVDYVCECGSPGCLESIASEEAICRQVAAARGVNRASVAEAVDLARGDPRVASVLAGAGDMVGREIGNLLNLFNPELIIVTGEGIRMGEMFLGPLQSAIRESAFRLLATDPRIVIQPLGDEAWAQGAASLIVHEMLRPPIYESRAMEPLAHLLGRGRGDAAGTSWHHGNQERTEITEDVGRTRDGRAGEKPTPISSSVSSSYR